ncbi:DUF6566 family protein [Xanthomonas hortorum pv. vitians]|uniref:DUF6566 family protein n=2 Tax=Xanthomonas hortorum pv. vitians TaxID=83224 RepID=A0AAW8ZXG5_9XANT|nr:DUF6566 family protein [Xanthomonas hortorum]MCC4626010.1 hypothetical protein [Xanthomonas campestris pv. nigromaculans]APP83391.1 hypothetical protein BI317_03575 [Xanthomonas hortorum pv. gardneri]ASW46781.1 hypothetical protein XJ27_12995 [Xanthomonas hortorum]MCC8492600.1 hypothetical protein [Xanthomonas hortorum pv. gardneri]MCC8553021.1 hypothetical protein [Xanthomonas hortorum pv. gardneri]
MKSAFLQSSRGVLTVPSKLTDARTRDRLMSRQSRFETTTYRDHEIRVRVERAAPDANWTVQVDVYALGGQRQPRIDDQGPGWETYQDAIAHGFQAGRKLIDAQFEMA